ncbi:hypothetical protein IWX63_003408, partial [Arthrobacter sp. CAN_A2]
GLLVIESAGGVVGVGRVGGGIEVEAFR